MKICHFSSAHAAGDTRIFRKECVSAAAAGHEVHLVIPSENSGARRGVHVHALRKDGDGRVRRMLFTAWRAYTTARDLRADIYQFHDPELIPFGLLLEWKGHCVVYDVHEDVPRQIYGKPYINLRLRKLVSWLFEHLENFAARRFDAIVTATPHIRKRFARLNPRSVDINNYPLLNEFQLATASSTKAAQVCYVGAITQARGVESMVKSLQYTKAKLKMAGRFQEKGLEGRLKQLPGWKQVDFLGFVEREDLQPVFAESSAGLVLFFPLPNHVDAQPNKMFEYMAASMPVIASDFPLWREIIQGNQCGLCVDPEDSVAIGNAIEFILTHPDEARSMGENGRRAVLARYHWENEEQKLLALYKELSDERR